ncbi:MAG TPA: class I SAM-dependent methyltransferase [Balneolales bacterium]|nr:class I SAM-dependent methyltransferase [Balneolales bacterium]
MTTTKVQNDYQVDRRATSHVRNRYSLFSHVYDIMEWPIERWAYQDWRKQLWAGLPSGDILEIGAGTGKNIPYYRSDMEIAAIDLTPAMLGRYEKRLKANPVEDIHAVPVIMDAQDLTFEDDTFDAVVATFVFCSVPDPVRGLSDALRVTRPGGELHLLEHMAADSSGLRGFMRELDRPFHYLTGVHIARETVANVQKSGWTIESIQVLNGSGIFKKIVARKV